MRLDSSVFVASLLYVASLASADPVTYDVSVNTSSISGTAGSLDFNFNPGPLVTQTASLQILNFMSNGTLPVASCLLGGPCLTGDVTGALPGTLVFENGTAFNDYFEDFTFGTMLSFEVRLYGPALSSPDGTSTSGTKLAFSLFSDGAGTMPTLTTDTAHGFAFTVDVNLDGTTTVSNFSPETSIGMASAVPEPNGLRLLTPVIALMGGMLGVKLGKARMNRVSSCQKSE